MFCLDCAKSKVKLLCSAICNHQDCWRPLTLYWQTCSIENHLVFVLKCASLSVARHSYIQLSELEQCRVNNIANDFTRQRNIRSLSRETIASALQQWWCPSVLSSLLVDLFLLLRPPDVGVILLQRWFEPSGENVALQKSNFQVGVTHLNINNVSIYRQSKNQHFL